MATLRALRLQRRGGFKFSRARLRVRRFGNRFRAQRGGRLMKKRFALARRQRGFVRVGGLFRMTPGNIGPEQKFFDSSLGATATSNAGTVPSPTLVLINQGTSVSTMLGKKINVTKIMIQGISRYPAQLSTTQSNIVEGTQMKIYIYLDKQCNGTAATVANLLETADFNAFREIDTTTQFTMLKKIVVDVKTNVTGFDDGGVNTWSANEVAAPWSAYISGNFPIEYSGTTGRTIANIRSTNIGILVLNSLTGVTVSPTIEYRWRIRFTDS